MKDIYVEIFERKDYVDLQSTINDFLQETIDDYPSSFELVDIKYVCYSDEYGESCYSAMIIYKVTMKGDN